MRVLVTGASGFIGAALCAQLRERGHDVAALVRREGSEPPGTRALLGDLGDGARLTAIVGAERPDCVVHLAAEIASQRSERKVREVNVDGTGRLLEACVAASQGDPASGPRLVFSSTVVTGDAHGALLSEDEPLPVQTPYGRSKQEGERLVLGSGLPAVVVRPSHVYGPGGWYANELIPRLRQPGRFAVIGSGENLWDVVHVDDVVSALILAVEGAPAGSIYHVADDEPIAFYDFMALTAKALGVGPPRRIPAALARIAAGSNAVDAVVRSARSSNAKIKRELDWQPRFPSAREGVADAVARLTALSG
ncbi:MAG TPA: NAD(P)-dependent oxidoreductase [Solirubrobacteraceae bacterium]|nr:NAD(P)-dependent oxidoreductase [Solirubrobacteraceae bacterium]